MILCGRKNGCYPAYMADETLVRAILRLDGVLTQAEEALALALARQAATDSDLGERHARLRVAAERAVADLDALVGEDAG